MDNTWNGGNNKKTWYVKGVLLDSSSVLITDLTPATKYKGYMMQSTPTGNGPPSEVFILETPVGRK